MPLSLEDIGWNDALAQAFEEADYESRGWIPARLVRDNKITYGALCEDGDEYESIMCGKVYHAAESNAALPSVGDWVALEVKEEAEEFIIRALLPRQSCFSRKAPGKTSEEQVIAANVNTVVVMTDAGSDYNPRRMERYFTLIDRCGCSPVVLLNKSDLFDQETNEAARAEVQKLCPHADVYVTSAKENEGLEAVQKYLKIGQTVALIGSSGVGKSTLMNQLLGQEYQWVNDVNDTTGKGRHTTTARELVILEDGGILVDNPGIREVQMWTDEGTLRDSFSDLTALAAQCQFHDCKHQGDRGCAIEAAVKSGELAVERYESFLKLEEEIATLLERRKKRQMTVERRAKRKHRVKARNLEDRIDHEKNMRPERYLDGWED